MSLLLLGISTEKDSKVSESLMVVAILMKDLFSLPLKVGQRLNHINSLCLLIAPT